MTTDITVISEALSQQGYIILPDFIADKLVQQLHQHVTSLPSSAFNIAKIGRQQSTQQRETVRNDKTAWLSDIHPVEQAYLSVMEALGTQLNRQLFLGLRDFEAHFSHYPPGHFYQRHLDVFQGQSNRILSSVFYLNPGWQQKDKGELVLYKPISELPIETVLPTMGTLILFLSEQFPHEVIAAKRDRYSIAGWFRSDVLPLKVK